MNREKSLFAGIPLLQDRCSVVALAILVISLVLLLVLGISLIRATPAYGNLVADLAAAQQALEQARRMAQESPGQLKIKVATVEAALDQAVSVFPSEKQATDLLDDVYRYAADAGVHVAKLEKLVNTPEEESETVYATRRLLLEAVGDLRGLTTFISLLTQAAVPTFHLDGLKISPSWEAHTLTANLIVYSSSLSAGVTLRPTPDEVATSLEASELGQQLDQAWQAGDWPRSISLLVQIIEDYPEDKNARGMLYWAYVNNGYALLDESKRDEAITQFDRALGINPHGIEAADGLSEALETSWLGHVPAS